MNQHTNYRRAVQLSHLLCLFTLITILSTTRASASPVIPGLNNKHPLNENQIGALLLTELRCTACHASNSNNPLPQNLAPDLSNVGARIAPDYIQRFIADPTHTQPGTTMPNLLSSLPDNQRSEVAKAITHFLISQSPQPFNAQPLNPQDTDTGRTLFHTIGCVTCHTPRNDNNIEITPSQSISLANIPSKYSLTSLSNFLFQPTATHPSGRMPDMNLTRDESNSIANYLLSTPTKTINTPVFKINQNLTKLGNQYFQDYNCTACHNLPQTQPSKPSKPLSELDPTRGCLSPNPTGTPQYNLTASQKQALRATLAQPNLELTNTDQINITLTAFNCIACHVRDDFGGVPTTLNAYFQTSEIELGNEARIPPPLTGIGAKLRTEWFQNVLFNSETIRPYMHTRMPQFGEHNLAFLPALFDKTDTLEPVTLNIPEGKERKPISEAGQLMVGDKGLACIACHNFNDIETPGFKGLDLITSYERLKPNWFYRYMLNPAAFRPGIVMPNYWPDGHAVQTEILEGNTHKQIEALWFYLTLGRSARTPSGIRATPSQLYVTDTARTYRGRSNIASFRGIAVGLPDEPANLNYAFNAQNGSIAALWSGDYITARWSSQGSGDFNSVGRSIPLPQDISFFALPTPTTPWPLRPVVDKDNPENRNPLYPRNLGYAFKGYSLDNNSIPTFTYNIQNINIEDKTITASSNNTSILSRTFTFNSPTSQTLYFRALTGTIDSLDNNRFKTDQLQITTPNSPTLLRPISPENNQSELLIKLSIPKGNSKATILYELLP